MPIRNSLRLYNQLVLLVPLLMTIALPMARADQPTFNAVVTGGDKIGEITAVRRLQAFQIRLKELLSVPEDADLQTVDIGCIDCPDTEKQGDPDAAISKLTYTFYQKDQVKLAPVFIQAWSAVQRDMPADACTITFNAEPPKDPSCSNYATPCYVRYVCPLYSNCSKSTNSCVKCLPK